MATDRRPTVLVGKFLLTVAVTLVGGLAATQALSQSVAAAPGTALSEARPDANDVACQSTLAAPHHSAPNCTELNLFGSKTPMTPGASHRTTVVIRNTGARPIKTLMLHAGRCVELSTPTRAVDAGPLCRAFRLTIALIEPDGTLRHIGVEHTIGQLSRAFIDLPTPKASQKCETFRFTLILDRHTPNADIGDSIRQSISWQATP